MHDMIDRYVHQVGLYVSPGERKEIERELRSQIHDTLDARYGAAPTREQTADALKQLGDPRTMAASYSADKYLVGPELYPFLMTVLRFGLPLVPSVVVIASVIGAALDPAGSDWISVLIGSVFTAIQAALIFTGVVVLFFAILQHSQEDIRATAQTEFDPFDLPPATDASAVDRAEAGVGIAIAVLFGIAIVYFLQVGGLTLRFNLSDPGEVLPVPVEWLVVLLVTTFGTIALNLWALLRRRWTFPTLLAQIALELVGTVGLYYAIFLPVLAGITANNPELGASLRDLPALITVITVVLMVIADGSRLIRMWNPRKGVTT